MVEEYIELKDIKKDKLKSKVKSTLSAVGSGAKKIGSAVGSGAKQLGQKAVKSYKEYNSIEAQEKRLRIAERRAALQKRQARLRQSQPSFGGISNDIFGGGNFNMGSNLGGGNFDIGGNLGSTFGMISGSPMQSSRTMRTSRRKVVSYYRPKGSKRYRRKVSYKTIRKRKPSSEVLFDPFSQF